MYKYIHIYKSSMRALPILICYLFFKLWQSCELLTFVAPITIICFSHTQIFTFVIFFIFWLLTPLLWIGFFCGGHNFVDFFFILTHILSYYVENESISIFISQYIYKYVYIYREDMWWLLFLCVRTCIYV